MKPNPEDRASLQLFHAGVLNGMFDIRSKTLDAVRRDCSVALSSPATKVGGPPDLASIFPSFFMVLDSLVRDSLILFFGSSSLGCLPPLRATGAINLFPVVFTTLPVAFPVPFNPLAANLVVPFAVFFVMRLVFFASRFTFPSLRFLLISVSLSDDEESLDDSSISPSSFMRSLFSIFSDVIGSKISRLGSPMESYPLKLSVDATLFSRSPSSPSSL
mmetsp:Transcript_22698/g.63144  ORF Transcript_22698/g.63144 Transcript_22698/m.63144 type:complete len:217 (+) Transcript_22698:2885-3535(+)